MLYTLFFIILYLTKKYQKKNHEISDDTIDFFEVDDILNHPHNPSFYNNNWKLIYKEIVIVLFQFISISSCIYLDISSFIY